jgi:glycosyltransferase involved in cell wall biosynthesis
VNTPLLIISYWFAPSPAVGAKRFSFLAREFTRLGFDVHVITHQARGHAEWQADGSLPMAGRIHDVPDPFKLPLTGGSLLHRAVNALLRRLLKPLGWEFFWARGAARKAIEVGRTLPPGVIIATSPAHAALLAGARAARRLDWPLILDYRDPWSAFDWPVWRRSRAALWWARRFESPLVRRSAARVLNTPAMRDAFARFFPRAAAARNFVIPNGFEAVPEAAPPPADGPLVIVHAGEIFTGRSLLPILRAAARLRQRFPARPIRVITYGDLPPAEHARISAEGLAAQVEVKARVPFADLFAELQRAHVLLAVVGDHMPYSTPYKVYDYMAARRPILALAPPGAALFDLLAESGAGVCIERDDDAGIEQALEDFLRGDLTQPRARVERYRWSNLALQYRDVIEMAAGATEPRQAGERGTSSRTAPAGRST